MEKENFTDIKIFVVVANTGGFRAAANHLKKSPASVSEAVQRLEDSLGIRLFERSTRSVKLTSIGEVFYKSTHLAIHEIDKALINIEAQKNSLIGTLKISAPYSAGPFFLEALIAQFAKQYPEILVNVTYDDNKVNLLQTNIDVAIRSNTLLALDTHAVPVGPDLNMSIVASKSYVESIGLLKHPTELSHHPALCFGFGGSGNLAPWTFIGDDGPYTVQPNSKIITNDMRSLAYYASKSLGFAYLYTEIAKPYVQAGSLIEVLSEHVMPLPRYSINFTSKRHMSKALRAFIDLAKTFKIT
ncbi:LysR family transcriptional regulator [Marinomonas flavescens]|uniref:LysR family transcriptional regulator n=1 Tax=Marinomonas flavescens TaxID=2529379 RepID=UPI00105603EF|nr:LysR family transcriptional regulator [Marinomonas flavescens]